MASRGTQVSLLVLVLVVALTSWGGVRAQPSSGCTNVLMSMSSCLNYITGNSSSPAPSCCSALSNVVQSQPQCLCTALNGGVASSLGMSINKTRALQLPGACSVKTPPISKCNGGGGASTSGAAPAESPASVPDEEPQSPAGSESKTVPSTPGSTSDGSITKSSLHLLAFVFLSCTSALLVF